MLSAIIFGVSPVGQGATIIYNGIVLHIYIFALI